MKQIELLIPAIALYALAGLFWILYKSDKARIEKRSFSLDLSLEDLPQNSNKELYELRSEIKKLKDSIRILPKEPKEKESKSEFLTREFEELFSHIRGKLKDENTLMAIKSLMQFLESKGNVPSIASFQGDREAKYFRKIKAGATTTYDLLAKVSLREHTLNVVKEILFLLEKEYGNHSYVLLPQALFAAFGHDLGKLPEFRTGAYATSDHPEISAIAIRKWLNKSSLSEEEKENVIKAIKLHHSKPDEKLGQLLKKADEKAREHETLKYGIFASPLLELEKDGTLPVEIIVRLLEEIWEFINVKKHFKGKALYHAFTRNNIIFYDPDIASKALKDMGFNNLPEDDKEIKLLIDKSFRKHNLVWEKVKEGYYCIPVDIGNKTLYLGALNLTKVADFLGRLASELPQTPKLE